MWRLRLSRWERRASAAFTKPAKDEAWIWTGDEGLSTFCFVADQTVDPCLSTIQPAACISATTL